MLLKRQGFPEESELVICTVSKVIPNSIFCGLDEYGKQGMIHISEVAPGRIRNIRDYVSEGRVVVCKVLNVDEKRGYIDLSLRRVSEAMRRRKLDDVKKEQTAEKIVEFVANKLKTDVKKLYETISGELLKKHPSLYDAFSSIAVSGESLSGFNLDKKIVDVLDETIKQRIKPPEIILTGTFKIVSYAPDGIDVIKSALKPVEGDKEVSLKYVGNGSYLLKVTSPDYKSAEKKLKTVVDSTTAFVKKHSGVCEFARQEA